MKPLTETNLYLRDPEAARRLKQNAYESSVFEGASGLTAPPSSRQQARSNGEKRISDLRNIQEAHTE